MLASHSFLGPDDNVPSPLGWNFNSNPSTVVGRESFLGIRMFSLTAPSGPNQTSPCSISIGLMPSSTRRNLHDVGCRETASKMPPPSDALQQRIARREVKRAAALAIQPRNVILHVEGGRGRAGSDARSEGVRRMTINREIPFRLAPASSFKPSRVLRNVELNSTTEVEANK